MGAAAAELAVDEHVLLDFDLSAFDSKADQNRFVTDFTGRLFQRNRQPLHLVLVLEEATKFAPERGLPGARQISDLSNAWCAAAARGASESP